jgi:hypothetical protein
VFLYVSMTYSATRAKIGAVSAAVGPPRATAGASSASVGAFVPLLGRQVPALGRSCHRWGAPLLRKGSREVLDRGGGGARDQTGASVNTLCAIVGAPGASVGALVPSLGRQELSLRQSHHVPSLGRFSP